MTDERTVSETTVAEKIEILGGLVESAIIFDRSDDPKFAATERENLKKLGVRGNWKVIRKTQREIIPAREQLIKSETL